MDKANILLSSQFLDIIYDVIIIAPVVYAMTVFILIC